MKKNLIAASIAAFILAAAALLSAGTITASAEDVAMKYITPDEAAKVLGTEGYTFIDLRKAADYATSRIPGSILADMEAAAGGDAESGIANLKAISGELKGELILICYSGRAYAQAGTNALATMGYDMEKVRTLEGGFKAWSSSHADKIDSSAK